MLSIIFNSVGVSALESLRQWRHMFPNLLGSYFVYDICEITSLCSFGKINVLFYHVLRYSYSTYFFGYENSYFFKCCLFDFFTVQHLRFIRFDFSGACLKRVVFNTLLFIILWLVHLISDKSIETISYSFIIVVKSCCVEGLMEDKCTSNKHSR